MEVNAFHVATVPPIVKWVLMSGVMPKKEKTSSDRAVLDAVFVVRYVQEGC